MTNEMRLRVESQAKTANLLGRHFHLFSSCSRSLDTKEIGAVRHLLIPTVVRYYLAQE
jgi:hypothetical protein